MKDNKVLYLSTAEKATILDNFITRILGINAKSGVVLGSYQVLEMIEDIAIDGGYIECPTCHQKKNQKKKRCQAHEGKVEK